MGTAETVINTVGPPPGSPELLDPDAYNVVLLGPSGVGKTAIAQRLSRMGIVDVNPTVATRPPRSTESATATLDHVFMSPEEFAARTQEDEAFLVTKNYYGFDYGLPYLRQPPPGRIPLIVLKTDFMAAFTDYYSRAKIYQIETSPDIAYERMHRRGHQSEADIEERMKRYGPELDAGRRLAHYLFNNDQPLEQTVQLVAAQIRRDQP